MLRRPREQPSFYLVGLCCWTSFPDFHGLSKRWSVVLHATCDTRLWSLDDTMKQLLAYFIPVFFSTVPIKYYQSNAQGIHSLNIDCLVTTITQVWWQGHALVDGLSASEREHPDEWMPIQGKKVTHVQQWVRVCLSVGTRETE